MAQIYLPLISPFSVTGPLHDADDSHIQSHHVAYEIAALSRRLDTLVAAYEAKVAVVVELQGRCNEPAKPSKNKTLARKLKTAEKTLMASMLPHEIKQLRKRLKNLNADLMVLSRPQ